MKIGKRELEKLQKQMPKLPDIEYKYHYYCMECDNEWDSNERINICSYCPKCHCGDLHCYDENENDVEYE